MSFTPTTHMEVDPLPKLTRARRRPIASTARFFYDLVIDLHRHRRLLWKLGAKEIRTLNSGAALGRTWLFLEPFIYSMIMWFFFTKAMSFHPSGTDSYLAWLMPSMFVWYFLSNGITTSANSFRAHAYFFRERDFNVALLPFVSVLSALGLHVVFLAILVAILLLSHVAITVYWLQAAYYLFAGSIFIYAVSLFTASFSLFVKDIKNLITVGLQLLFWLSPIFWDPSSQSPLVQNLVKLNPLFHIVMGYRYSFVYAKPFWTDSASLIFFWAVTIVLLILGSAVFRLLRGQFGDVI